MYPIESLPRIDRLSVLSSSSRLSARFLSTPSSILADTEKELTRICRRCPLDSRHAASPSSAFVTNWRDVTTAHQAEHQVEDMYNAARTELIKPA